MTTFFESIAASLTAPATVRSRVTVPLRFPDGFSAVAEVLTFHGLADGKEHLLLAFGDWDGLLHDSGRRRHTPLVRLHSECLTGDVFGSERCDCGPQLREAVEQISAAGGFLLYLRQEGRGIGLYSKLDAYALQDTGLDTYEANRALGHGDDERDYTAAAQMLDAVGATSVRLLTQQPGQGRPAHLPRDQHHRAGPHRRPPVRSQPPATLPPNATTRPTRSTCRGRRRARPPAPGRRRTRPEPRRDPGPRGRPHPPAAGTRGGNGATAPPAGIHHGGAQGRRGFPDPVPQGAGRIRAGC